MDLSKEVKTIKEELAEIRAITLKRFEGFTREQLNWKPPGWTGSTTSPTNWSLGEVFMHIALDEHYLREQIARPLLEGIKPPEDIIYLPPPPPYGMSKQVIRFWFERYQFSSMVVNPRFMTAYSNKQ